MASCPRHFYTPFNIRGSASVTFARSHAAVTLECIPCKLLREATNQCIEPPVIYRRTQRNERLIFRDTPLSILIRSAFFFLFFFCSLADSLLLDFHTFSLHIDVFEEVAQTNSSFEYFYLQLWYIYWYIYTYIYVQSFIYFLFYKLFISIKITIISINIY